jgi:hypothetical protein
MLGGLAQAAGAAAALAVVVLLVLLSGRAARLLPVVRQAEGEVLMRRRGTLALDARRRLHLVEANGRQALVLTGGAQDVLIAWNPPAGGTTGTQA